MEEVLNREHILKVNIRNRKVNVSSYRWKTEVNVLLNRRKTQEVEKFSYLESNIIKDRWSERDIFSITEKGESRIQYEIQVSDWWREKPEHE